MFIRWDNNRQYNIIIGLGYRVIGISVTTIEWVDDIII